MSLFSQAFPPAPTFTEEHLPDLQGKVYIVTGAAVGVGYQLAKMLYAKNATIYIATRSQPKIDAAIASLQTECPSSKGTVKFVLVDLSDLTTIGPAARQFLAQETRLDVLVHNAAVMTPPTGSKSKQGHDLEMATNCLGPFLLSKYLEGIQRRTASTGDVLPSSVRTVWVSSSLHMGPVKGGIIFGDDGAPVVLSNSMNNYMASKVGDAFLAHEWAERMPSNGGIHMSVHPGLMRTELQRHMNPLVRCAMGVVFKPAQFGAYSELFAGFAPDVRPEHNGGFIIPWGRLSQLPEHLAAGYKSKEEGGTSASKQFWDWCVQETAPFFKV